MASPDSVGVMAVTSAAVALAPKTPSVSRAMLAAGATVVAMAAGALGFLAGLRSRGWSRGWSKRRRRDKDSLLERLGWNECICECGVLLPAECTEEEVERHRCSNRHKANLHALRDASELVVCEEVGEYRAAAKMLVNNTEYVMEVGSHVGGTTKVIASVAKHVVGIDQQASLVEEARKNLPDVQFEVCDAFDAARIIEISKKLKPNRWSKIFVDISGSRDLSTVVRLLDMYEKTLRPDVIVVKSQTLKRLLLRSRLWVDHPKNNHCRWRLWGELDESRNYYCTPQQRVQ